MTAPAFNQAGSLFALGMRLARLAENGAPLVGTQNAYVTDALVQAELGLEYEDGEEIIQRNGAGQICLTYRAPDSLTRGTISSLQICAPDPVVLAFLTGGTIIVDDEGNPAGYQAPEVGGDPNPNGVSIELWTRAIIAGAFSGFYWWVLPRAFVRPSGTWALSGENPLIAEFEGNLTQNANWGDGPGNDFTWPSDRVWQFMQVDTLPVALSPPRYVDVEVELTTTSVAVTPAADSIAVDETLQLNAEATMSDASIRDVTQTAVWTTADESIVSVGEDGLAVGEAVGGPIDVTATYGGQSDAAAITVA